MDFSKSETKIINDTYLFILRMIEFNTTMERLIEDAFKYEKKNKRPITIIKYEIINSFVQGRYSSALKLAYMSTGFGFAAMSGAMYYDFVKHKYKTRSNWLKLLKMYKQCRECEYNRHKRVMENLKW